MRSRYSWSMRAFAWSGTAILLYSLGVGSLPAELYASHYCRIHALICGCTRLRGASLTSIESSIRTLKIWLQPDIENVRNVPKNFVPGPLSDNASGNVFRLLHRRLLGARGRYLGPQVAPARPFSPSTEASEIHATLDECVGPGLVHGYHRPSANGVPLKPK
uniref:Putative secreted protein ovary overexpressed n=1 Tax=Rhipicephalus microplus TaxID=6941 RepID=A0A6M2DB94_RHIMP